jgi:hypothetical protein
MDELINGLVRAQAAAWSDRMEEYCEKSLTDSLGRGVLVHNHTNGFLVQLSSDVPWATIHEHNMGTPLPR